MDPTQEVIHRTLELLETIEEGFEHIKTQVDSYILL